MIISDAQYYILEQNVNRKKSMLQDKKGELYTSAYVSEGVDISEYDFLANEGNNPYIICFYVICQLQYFLNDQP